MPESSGEQLQLFTDRSFYGVSEKVFYSVMYSGPVISGSRSWSTVMYVELINWDGTKIGHSKVPVRDGFAAGSIRIPYDISSGNYYLRAYTKWMRNYSAYSYAYIPVKIVNPFSEAIVAGPEKNGNTAGAILPGNPNDLKGIVVSGLQEVYDKREMISLEIQMDSSALPGTFSMGVVRAGGFNAALRPSVYFDRTIEQEGERVVEYLPELYGLSLAGQLVDETSGFPVGNTRLNLSSVSEPFHFSSDMTDDDGAFLFTLPYDEDLHELHIAPEGDSGREYKLLITGEFCNKTVHLPYVPFALNNQEREMARELLLNIQINERFEEVIQSDRQEHAYSIPFYGRPASVTYVKDYIELINLEEFFYELIRSVTVSSRGKDPYLVVNSQGSLGMSPPLVLMDNIKVKNDKSLLETSARRVERIEVVNRGYVIGNEKYSGIISVFSTAGDMAGLKIENGSRFFNYRLYDTHESGFTYIEKSSDQAAFPDRRITLFWEPKLQLSEEASNVRFYTSDVPGEYEIVIRGIDSQDNLLEYRTATFTVK